MAARAHVQFDPTRDGVSIWLAELAGNGPARVAQPIPLTYVESDEGVAVEPSMRLPEATARALLDALSVHFGGTSDTRQLRGDYEAERRRVDRFIDHLTHSRCE